MKWHQTELVLWTDSKISKCTNAVCQKPQSISALATSVLVISALYISVLFISALTTSAQATGRQCIPTALNRQQNTLPFAAAWPLAPEYKICGFGYNGALCHVMLARQTKRNLWCHVVSQLGSKLAKCNWLCDIKPPPTPILMNFREICLFIPELRTERHSLDYHPKLNPHVTRDPHFLFDIWLLAFLIEAPIPPFQLQTAYSTLTGSDLGGVT